MDIVVRQFGSTATENSDLFGSLGINWTLLGLQTLAFVILLLILKKFVYPPLVAMLDRRDEVVKASADAAMEAEKHAAEAEARTAELLDEAKREAADIVTTAKEEASKTAEEVARKAEAKADALLANALARQRKAHQACRQAPAKMLAQHIHAHPDGAEHRNLQHDLGRLLACLHPACGGNF